MLATYYTLAQGTAPTPSLSARLAQRHIDRSRRWAARSRTRESCDDAYSDLILATLEFGMARGQAEQTVDLQERLALIDEINQLMTELLEWSHELRVYCRMPMKPITNSVPIR